MYSILTLFLVLMVWATASPVQQNQDFSKAVERLVRILKLPETRVQQVPCVLKDIERVLGAHWPGCQAVGFGSSVTDLMIAQSDVDTLIRLNHTDIDVPTETIVEAKTILEQSPTLFKDFQMFLNTIDPILVFRHIPSGFSVDLIFKNELPVRNSQLLRYLLHIDERVLDLAIIVKHWAQLHKITGEKGFPSSGMTVLLVSYLQQVEVLPPVVLLQKNAQPHMINNWNTGFEEINYKPRSNLSQYELLGGFFEYYESFNFEEGIVSIFVGYPMKRQVFEVLQDVPQEFDLYKRNVELNLTQSLSCEQICIQDPFVHSMNYAESDYNTYILKSGRNSTFMIQLRRAVLKYRENNGSQFLDQILTVVT